MDLQEEASSSTLKQCSIGARLNQKCHKSVYTRKSGLLAISSLAEEDRELLELRTELDLQVTDDICLHHEKLFISRYDSLQKFCCDPFHCHKKRITSTLKSVSKENAKKFGLKPGQKLCQKCEKQSLEMQRMSSESSLEDFEDPAGAKDSVNESMQLLGVSPLKYVSQRDKSSYGKRKVKDVKKATTSRVADLLDLPTDELMSSEEDRCEGCKDLHILIDLLKKKCQEASLTEKIKILTLIPDSWPIAKITEEFDVTIYQARRARLLKKDSGILADTLDHRGRAPLDATLKDKVINFYQSDEYSRMCPGKKDYVSVKIAGKREQKQKRMLLINMKELHLEFLDKTDSKISFAKFCELRPKWCVPVSSPGMHSVCVCQHHQNAKLLVAAIPDNAVDYKHLLGKMVCLLESRECMLHYCDNCPGKDSLKEYLLQVFEDSDMDGDDIVRFKQWMHTDRTTLVTQQLSVSDFVTHTCDAFHDLRPHHFIAKSQSKYLSDLKENLGGDTAIVLLDFAENYSFVVQDAVQGQHWDNSQVTLHPFVMYHKGNQGTESSSFCVISECLKHDTATVHAFTTVFLRHVKQSHPQIKKILYFSDGAASQYKNFKNFANLYHHQEDHGLEAEWHFFATSHGKSPCDGIGGTVKRLVARASLQATTDNQILTPEQMFAWARLNIPGVRFFYLTSADIQRSTNVFKLEERFSFAKTVLGTRSHHSFIPSVGNQLQMRRVSCDDMYTSVMISKRVTPAVNLANQNTDAYQPGKYVAAVYDNNWYIGTITERDDDEQDVHVNFMKQGRGNAFAWPPEQRKDQCWVPFNHVLCTVELQLSTQLGRRYKLTESDFKKVKELYHKFSQ